MFFPLVPVYHLLFEYCNREKIRVVRYRHERHSKLIDRLKYRIQQKFMFDSGLNWPFRVFATIGFKSSVYPKLNFRGVLSLIKVIIEKRFVLKTDVINWKIEGLHVGDLFYDWHLRNRSLATVNLQSLRFYVDILLFASHYFWWKNELLEKKPKFLFTSHTCYIQGLVARLALNSGSLVFNVGDHWFNKLDQERPLADIEFHDYNPKIKSFNGYEVDLLRSKLSLTRLMEGKSDENFAHLTVDYEQFTNLEHNFSFLKDKKNILIAAHCFSDSPNGIGQMAFPDFLECLEFLGKKSINLKHYNWYIKAHPSFIESDDMIFSKFCRMNPHIKIVPKQIRTHEILKDGIDCVITCYGTIAIEAAFHKVLTISCSSNFPSVNYSFARAAKNVKHLNEILDSLDETIDSYRVNEDEVLHFYDLHYLRRARSWLWDKHQEDMLNKSGGYPGYFFLPKVLEYWVDFANTDNRFELKLKVVTDFLSSKNYLVKQEF